MGGVALGIVRADLPHGIPGAQVGPAGVQRHHAHHKAAVGLGRALLHHGVVDRFRRHGLELFFARAHELRVGAAHLKRFAGGVGNVGAEVAQRGQPARGLHDEHAAVPEVAAIGQVGFGGLQVGLFDKSSHGAHALGVSAAGADVAKAGFGLVWGDAQDNDVAIRRGADGRLQGGRVGLRVGHRLVGRGDDQDGVAAIGRGLQRCQGDGRGGVAASGLQQQRRGLALQFAQLVQHQKAVLFIAHHAGLEHRDVVGPQGLQAQVGLLEQALVVVLQDQKLLGVQRTRQGPQSGP